ncbi:hypothetical protein AVEN_48690-1 [Araneus ventricosus]|uniref:Uncharacterized protein n=1 Tax=Araneus ventricosus TaxID=182803 RepID=A0A4Y2FXF1_ARAVE|nr:hypothetical protein AVEN_48690-1 [Araneus ventricosus]
MHFLTLVSLGVLFISGIASAQYSDILLGIVKMIMCDPDPKFKEMRDAMESCSTDGVIIVILRFIWDDHFTKNIDKDPIESCWLISSCREASYLFEIIKQFSSYAYVQRSHASDQ